MSFSDILFSYLEKDKNEYVKGTVLYKKEKQKEEIENL